MSASSTLDEYIKKFKSSYQKYIPSDTVSSIGTSSSIDTEDLLSDISDQKPEKKKSIKTLSALKRNKRIPKVNQPKHKKPLNSKPLMMICEEEEYTDFSKIQLDKYLPQIAQQKKKIFNDFESDATSICSSVDTEVLLQSSSDDEEPPAKWTDTNQILNESLNDKFYQKPRHKELPYAYKEEEEEKPSSKPYVKYEKPQQKQVFEPYEEERKEKKQRQFEVIRTTEVSISSRKMETHTNSLGYFPSKKVSPSSFLNNITNSSLILQSQNLSKITLCTCILNGSLYQHFRDCRTQQVSVVMNKKQTDILDRSAAAIKIQRFFRRIYKRKLAQINKNKVPQSHMQIPLRDKNYSLNREDPIIVKNKGDHFGLIYEKQRIDSDFEIGISHNKNQDLGIFNAQEENIVIDDLLKRSKIEFEKSDDKIDIDFSCSEIDMDASDCDTEELLNSTINSDF